MFDYTGTYTDQYQLTMAQVYFLQGHQNKRAVFDYFFRKLPFQGGYAVFAGLDDLLNVLTDLRFNSTDLAFLKAQGFHPDFISYLKHFRFQGNIYAVSEGDIVFPTAPIVTVEANIIEAQLIETILLNLLNFQTLIATKASRIRQVAQTCELVDFGLRRAQGAGGYEASRAAIIGGFDATSNVRVGRDYNIPVSGTMSHAFVQSYETELTAFRAFSEIWPDRCVLLVDTYDTLNSGLPNAIQIAKELAGKGHNLKGIRLDSGDLGALAKAARQRLNDAGLAHVKIAASNELDEFAIATLVEKNAPIDFFGVGTSLVIGRPDAALDGVYKLAAYDETPRIKLSESISKITLPAQKQVLRLLDADQRFCGMDVVALRAEQTISEVYDPYEMNAIAFPVGKTKQRLLLQSVMHAGERCFEEKSLTSMAAYHKEQLGLLPDRFKRLQNSDRYQVAISAQLMKQRDQLVRQFKGERDESSVEFD